MPNGMGISPDRKKLYFTVSEEYLVYVFDFNEYSGTLRNRNIFARFPKENGTPDGLTVNPDTGDVVIAFWNGGRLAILDSTGKQKQEIHFPIEKITSVEFANKNLFITTGNRPWQETAWKNHQAGSIFMIRHREEKK